MRPYRARRPRPPGDGARNDAGLDLRSLLPDGAGVVKNPRARTGRWHPPDLKSKRKYPPILSRRVKEWMAFAILGLGVSIMVFAVIVYLSG